MARMNSASAAAGQRSQPRRTSRGSPYLPPSGACPRGPNAGAGPGSSTGGGSGGGGEGAAAGWGWGGNGNGLQIGGGSVGRPAGRARRGGEPKRFSACRKATRAPASKVG